MVSAPQMIFKEPGTHEICKCSKAHAESCVLLSIEIFRDRAATH